MILTLWGKTLWNYTRKISTLNLNEEVSKTTTNYYFGKDKVITGTRRRHFSASVRTRLYNVVMHPSGVKRKIQKTHATFENYYFQIH